MKLVTRAFYTVALTTDQEAAASKHLVTLVIVAYVCVFLLNSLFSNCLYYTFCPQNRAEALFSVSLGLKIIPRKIEHNASVYFFFFLGGGGGVGANTVYYEQFENSE